jgi:hypothetical protein
MARTLVLALALGALLIAGCGGGGGPRSTRVDVEDDTKGPRHSGPYAADAVEVSREVVRQMRRQRVLERFFDEYGEPPIVALIRPVNETRFPEVTRFFQTDFVTALMENFTRDEIRIVERETEREVIEEKERKEAGELTDRTGRRTRLGADFFIRAKFVSLSVTDGRQSDDTMKYTYQFIDAETTELIFQGDRTIRRVSSASAIHR